ncbi:COX3 oxidase, partial [Acromyrmex heyeri]
MKFSIIIYPITNYLNNLLAHLTLLGTPFILIPFIVIIESISLIYGSTFFIATGFHGIHVIIGTLFLSICLIRFYNIHFSSYVNHFGFEAAS